MRIRVTTRAHLFEEPKREHIGYRIEDERPYVNGLCSFVAVRDQLVQDTLSALVAEAVCGNRGRCNRLVRNPMLLKIRFRFDGKCIRHPGYNPRRYGRPLDGNCDGCESLYFIHLHAGARV